MRSNNFNLKLFIKTLAKNLEATITELGFTDSLSWSTQSSSPPDTNVSHYPRLMYYYHPVYLGHVEYITDLDGLPYQHFYYTAWGETLLEQKATRPGMNFDSPYRFNDYGGKSFDKAFDEHSARSAELDDETGLYYYGARYYNPVVSVWLGVDPLTSQFPHQSPYVFTDNNPIMLWDPTGMSAEEAEGGGFWNKLGNWFSGNGWRTNEQIKVEADNLATANQLNGTILGDVTVTAEAGIYDAQLYSHQSADGSGEAGGFIVGYRDGGSNYSLRGFNFKHTSNKRTVSAEVSGLSGEIEGNLGAVNSQLKADVFHAKAKIINAPLRKAVEVGAYAAKVETSIKVFGLGVTFGGSFGSAHVGFDAGTEVRTDGSFISGISGHLGFGAGIKVGISYDSRKKNQKFN